MTKYADGTKVPVLASRIEIERMLEKHEADAVSVGFAAGRAVVAFKMHGRGVRFLMDLPRADVFAKLTRRGRYGLTEPLPEGEQKKRMEQATREAWRALVLTIKAKLVSVENGVEQFETAFMAHIVMPGGKTVGEMAMPSILEAYRSGQDVPLLGSGT